MRLLFVRHGIAVDGPEWAGTGRPDRERPLTDRGRARMKRVAAGIAVAEPRLDLVATSPFTRAMQTAQLLAKAYGDLEIAEVPALAAPLDRDGLVEWLSGHRHDRRIALVGHEPALGALVGWFLFGSGAAAVPMRKGGACLLRFDGGPEPGRGQLRWFLGPALLASLAP